ncbi:MAG: hypothetical protein GY865_11960 [candidate division Zixibacteria bacterium]|nr:hypothetical protein [candidate division Zixibacteria bacterium]
MAERTSSQSPWTWMFQRLSGLFLGFFLVTHLNVHHLFHDITSVGLISFDTVRANLSSSGFWKIYYFLFVPFVVFHALNGLWAIIADYRIPKMLVFPIKAAFWAIAATLIITGFFTLKNLF